MMRGGPAFGEEGVVPPEGGWLVPLGLSLVAGVLDDEPHSPLSVIVGKIAQDPNSGVVHFHDGRNALAGADPQDGNRCRVWNGITVQCDHPKAVARQSQAPNLGCAAVENVKEK